MTVRANTIAYFEPKSKAYKPEKAVFVRKKAWDKVVMLSGDHVYVISVRAGVAVVSAKGHHLKIPVSHLTTEPKLQVHFIDCGQGDAALVNFPDGRWMMIDAGPPRVGGWTNTGKIAFDFLKWKIFVDFSWRKEFNFDPHTMTQGDEPVPFHLDSIVLTHPDYDHYGGWLELPRKIRETDPYERITIGTVYHCGLGRFSGPYKKLKDERNRPQDGMSQLGPVKGELPESYLTTLIDGFEDVRKYAKPAGRRRYTLHGKYGDWLNELESLEGNGIGQLKRIHHKTNDGYLPTFEKDKDVSIKILGPVEERYKSQPALRYIDSASAVASPSKTRNGLSVVLRIDYKDAKILMTGDLNFKSQAVLLEHIDKEEYASHVVKACHHGAEDISWTFLQATNPAAVVISSGDNESHVHPRAKVLGWSGAFARKMTNDRQSSYLGLTEERLQTPLIYSTEIARSVELFEPYAVYSAGDDGELDEVRVPYIQPAGRSEDSRGDKPAKHFTNYLIAEGLKYGLVNMRTDGETIEMGVLAESGNKFHVETIDTAWDTFDTDQETPTEFGDE